MWDYINSITFNKQNLMEGTANDKLAEKEYPSFLVNKALSYFPDTILYANEMNINHQLDNKLQYSYLLNNVRPMKRFSKWVKKEDSNDMDVVKEYYGYNNEKAKAALSVLSTEQIIIIREKLEEGGVNESSRNSSRNKASKGR